MQMSTHQRLLPAEELMAREAAVDHWGGSFRRRLTAWAANLADNYAAAAAYDSLSRLSDAELKRRGLSRDILARDLGGGT